MSKAEIDFNTLPVGKRMAICEVAPLGALVVRKQADGGIVFYWRYQFAGVRHHEIIGMYGSECPPRSLEPNKSSGRFSKTAAIQAAQVLATRHLENITKGGGGFAEIKEQRAAAKKAREKAAADKLTQTVNNLFTMYADNLQRDKTRGEALNIFKNHVAQHHEHLLALPAADIDAEAWSDVIRVSAVKAPRVANKLRTFLHAAYNMALYARTDASVPIEFKRFNITSNPIASIRPVRGANTPDKNPFSLEEMRTYWQAIKSVDGVKGAALRIHLLTGGLRPLQLLRLTAKDVRDGAFTLYDIKGKRDHAEPYTTPILKRLKADFDLLATLNTDGYLFSNDGGKTAVRQETLLQWAQGIVGDTIKQFQIKRVRSGVETLLGAKRIDKEIRGLLQSHGVSGVQRRHYDGNDYLQEKAHALQVLEVALTETTTPIIKMNEWAG